MLLLTFPAAAQTATSDLHFFNPTLLLFALATPTASQPPSLLTRDIEVLGEECKLANWGNIWTYEGNTADGRCVGFFSERFASSNLPEHARLVMRRQHC